MSAIAMKKKKDNLYEVSGLNQLPYWRVGLLEERPTISPTVNSSEKGPFQNNCTLGKKHPDF